MKAHIGLSGHYTLVRRRVLERDGDGFPTKVSEPLETLEFDNLITNAGLDMLGESNDADKLAYCRLGTGNTTPANSDVNLQTQVGASNAAGLGSEAGVSIGGDFVYRRASRRFSEGTVSGLNLSEVGMGPAATGNLFSRALITDALGNPTTITLDSDEILDVVYELRAYLPTQDQVFNVTIDGSANVVTQRYSTKTEQLTVFGGRLGLPFRMASAVQNWSLNGTSAESNALKTANAGFDEESSGTGGMANAIAYSAYVAGTHTRTATLTYNITNANYATGIGRISVGTDYVLSDGRDRCTWPAVLYTFNTKLNKTNVRKATVAVSISWARH